jgi:hypothetical protein
MMRAKTKLAVAMTAMTLATVYGGIGLAAAQARDEVLQAATTTFNAGGSGTCFTGSASANFDSAGSTTGGNGVPAPYPGTFAVTAANVNVTARVVPVPGSVRFAKTLTLSVPFTITSGSTTITGTVTNPAPYAGGSLLCGSGSMPSAGVIVAANGATYAATIQSTGQPAKKISGTAQVSAAFQFRPRYVVGAPPTITLLDFPSP